MDFNLQERGLWTAVPKASRAYNDIMKVHIRALREKHGLGADDHLKNSRITRPGKR